MMKGLRAARWPAFALACLVLVTCGDSGEEPGARAEAVGVRLARVESSARAAPYEAVGSIRARDTVVIAAKVLSHIDAVHVDVGDEVRRGALLIALDDRELTSALRQAEAARVEVEDALQEATHGLESARAEVELARATHARFTELREKDSVSAHEFDQVTARLRGAEAAVRMAESRRRQVEARRVQVDAQVEGAQVQVGYTQITAPIRGIVTARHVDAGSLAVPGMPLLTLERAGGFELEVSASSRLLDTVSVGQSATVTVDAAGGGSDPLILTGEVIEIVPTIDPVSRTFTVKLGLPAHEGLRSGMFARAQLVGEMRERLLVAASAVIERGQLQSVFVVEDDVAQLRLVSLGALADGAYEVLSGLVAGEQVVLDPVGLSDGQAVVAQAQR